MNDNHLIMAYCSLIFSNFSKVSLLLAHFLCSEAVGSPGFFFLQLESLTFFGLTIRLPPPAPIG